jgi:hypothetical protein
VIARRLVVQLQPVIAKPPVVANARHPVDHQRFHPPERLERGSGSEAGVASADDEHGRVAVGVAQSLPAPVCTENFVRVDDVMELPKLAG